MLSTSVKGEVREVQGDLKKRSLEYGKISSAAESCSDGVGVCSSVRKEQRAARVLSSVRKEQRAGSACDGLPRGTVFDPLIYRPVRGGRKRLIVCLAAPLTLPVCVC